MLCMLEQISKELKKAWTLRKEPLRKSSKMLGSMDDVDHCQPRLSHNRCPISIRNKSTANAEKSSKATHETSSIPHRCVSRQQRLQRGQHATMTHTSRSTTEPHLNTKIANKVDSECLT
eukprot:CCRYP_010195-RA/>CCRYP_010195-RA protein AED:0.05 eAED:0.05 QI:372/1/1/1/0/0/2/51/118